MLDPELAAALLTLSEDMREPSTTWPFSA